MFSVSWRRNSIGERRRRSSQRCRIPGQLIGSAPRPQTGAAPEETPPGGEEGRVIIVGYGRVGALIGDMLHVHKIPFIAVDSDARFVARARAAGKRVYYGDASRPDYLRRCGVETARAVVVTMDLPSANEAVVETTRSIRRDVTLVARARDAAHARALYGLGLTDAVPETFEAAQDKPTCRSERFPDAWPHHRRYPARGSPPGAHRYPPRYAPPAARRARRYARVPPMDSGDEPLPMIKRGPFSMPMGGSLFDAD